MLIEYEDVYLDFDYSTLRLYLVKLFSRSTSSRDSSVQFS